TGRTSLVESAQHAALGAYVLVTACLLLLAYAFLSFDFSVRYVASNTNLGTPFYYRLTAVWGALEGSIVLWAWMLSVYTLIVVLRHRTNARELYPWVLSVMLGILAFFLHWLTGTAFLHSVMIQERRRMLRLWNLALVIMTFSLTLFGTFLTRSGVIASVHAFTQGSIGVFFLSFLALVLLLALALLAWRWDTLGAQGELDSVVSRESAFLLNNVLLVAAAFTVFFGTVFPLLSEAVRGVKVSVGAPFFNQVNVPLFLGLIFLMGVGPLIAWRRAS